MPVPEATVNFTSRPLNRVAGLQDACLGPKRPHDDKIRFLPANWGSAPNVDSQFRPLRGGPSRFKGNPASLGVDAGLSNWRSNIQARNLG